MHHQCIHQYTINEFITASSMNSSMHSSMHHQCIVHRAMHHQIIHQCISNAFIIAFINASSVHHQSIINAFIASNASISLSQFFLSSSVHRLYIYQCITNVLINVFVVVNFLSQVIFVFLFFLGMIMYANEVETKEK